MRWFDRPPAQGRVSVVERIRPLEVPVLTEVKRFLGRDDVAGAVRYAYPRVVEDLARGYAVEIPPGYSHEEIRTHCFKAEMMPSAEFFDHLYRIYAPVRYGELPPPGGGNDLIELLQSLYSAEPMWRLYLNSVPARPVNGGADAPTNGSAGTILEEGAP